MVYCRFNFYYWIGVTNCFTAIQLIGSTHKIASCNFYQNYHAITANNSPSSFITLSSFSNQLSTPIQLFSSFINLDGSSFSSNKAELGGAVYSESSSLYINSFSCVNNRASISGGCIHSSFSYRNIVNANLVDNAAEHGGSIYSHSSTSVITFTTFSNNNGTRPLSQMVTGSSLYQLNTTTNITNCDFNDNLLANIFSGSTSYLYIQSCTFTRNNMAIYTLTTKYLSITDSLHSKQSSGW